MKYTKENLLLQIEKLKETDIIKNIEIIKRKYFDEYFLTFENSYTKEKNFNEKIRNLISHLSILYHVNAKLIYVLTEDQTSPEIKLQFNIWKI